MKCVPVCVCIVIFACGTVFCPGLSAEDGATRPEGMTIGISREQILEQNKGMDATYVAEADRKLIAMDPGMKVLGDQFNAFLYTRLGEDVCVLLVPKIDFPRSGPERIRFKIGDPLTNALLVQLITETR